MSEPEDRRDDYADAERELGQTEDWSERARVREALEQLLNWAERYRGGDPSLDPEEWYIARDYARIALEDSAPVVSPEQQEGP